MELVSYSYKRNLCRELTVSSYNLLFLSFFILVDTRINNQLLIKLLSYLRARRTFSYNNSANP